MKEMISVPNDSPAKPLAVLIHDYCGINYLDDLPSLLSKVTRRLAELKMTVTEYADYLRVHRREWDRLIELVTINETYFFREDGQLDLLRKEIFPQHRGESPLKIWSAACSTGEEPYSIGMVASDSGASVQIIGSDINKKVLETARTGWYSKNSLCFRRTTPEQLARFFTAKREGYEVNRNIRERVSFREVNLQDGAQVRGIGEVDIVFCRNVMIYFDSPMIRKVLGYFHSVLKPGGYLFLGHAETVRGMDAGFETIHAPATFYYKKGRDALEPSWCADR